MAVPPAAIARRRIVRHFFSADAVRPQDAVTYEPGSALERRVFERLLDRRVVYGTGEGRFYLDVTALEEDRAEHRRKAGLLVGISLVAGIALGLIV
jgi:hypothetical protein